MSYKHLAGRLIETQRSMLGGPAIDIAQSVDGLTVTEDGNVTAIDGDGRSVVDELVGEYTDMLGSPAEVRLRTAAAEFEDELDLPESLGGPEETSEEAQPDGEDEADEPDTEGVDAADPDDAETAESADPDEGAGEADDAAADAVTDDEVDREEADETDEGDEMSDVPGTTIEVRSVDETAADGESGGAPEQAVEAVEEGQTAAASAEGADAGDRAGTDADPSPAEPVIVDYTTQGDVPSDGDGADLASVYLMREDENSWKAPIAVEDAIVDAVTSATDLGREELDDVDDYVEAERVLSVLGAEGSVSVTFDVEGLAVTLHPSGTVRVH